MTDEELKLLVASNARSIEALSTELRQGFTNTLQAINEQNQLLSELRERQEKTDEQVTLNNQQIDVLIKESQVNSRQHQDFRDRFEALAEILRSLLGEVLSRLNAIWSRQAS